MVAALDHYIILGIPTGIEFLRDVMKHPDFASGKTHTHFVDEHFRERKPAVHEEEAMKAAMVAAVLTESEGARCVGAAIQARRPTPWQALGHWTVGGVH